MSNQLFARKPLRDLLAEAEGDNRLKRVLGPFSLTALGVGAIIGAGIFVATGAAAKEVAGPALMLSYGVAGLTCIFAALCYAEFASMAPVAGSAYTYAYCTMGELFAWIIGWDLVLEYAVGAATVANGWSSYFQAVLNKAGILVPMAFAAAPVTYDEGVFRQNVFAEIRGSVVHEDGKLEENVRLRATHKLVDEKDAAGNKSRVLKWVNVSGYVEHRVTVEDEDGEPEDLTLFLPSKLVEVTDAEGGKAQALEWSSAETTRATIQGKDGKPVVVTPAKCRFEDVTNADGSKSHVLGWKQADGGSVLGAVGDAEVERRFSAIQPPLFNLPAIVIVLIITAVLIKGISESAGFNLLMVCVKVGAVLFVIVVGAFFIKASNWTDDFAPHGYGGISFFEVFTFGKTTESGKPLGVLAGAAIIFFAYIGFDSVSTHAEEARKPQRDVPIGIIASLILCTVLYVAVVAVLTGMVAYKDIDKGAGVSSAFKEIHLGWAEVIIAVAGVAGITSVLLVMMLSGPRVFLAMARDGLVPRAFFADVHPKFRTPWKSTIAIGVFVMILTGVLPIDALLELTNIGTLFAFAIVCGAVLIMRRTDPHAKRPFRCPLVPVVPILGILSCLMLMLSLPVGNWVRLIVWLLLGLCIYFTYGRNHSVLGKELRLGTPLGAAGKSAEGFLPPAAPPSTDVTDRTGTKE
jgi:amino acid transporter